MQDAKGNELKVGDEVIVRCRITEINPVFSAFNATVEFVEPLFRGQQGRKQLVVSAAQLEKV